VPVLIIAPESDGHAQVVQRHIRAGGHEVEVLDLSEFPQRSKVSIRFDCCGARAFGLSREDGSDLNLGAFGAVWWRRPHHPAISDEIASQSHRIFATNEAQEALSGLWHALDAFWINDPAKDHVAHRKVTQLRVAQEVGLRLPHTCITNDPHEARRFIDGRGYRDVVYKAFSALPNEWRETRILKPEELGLLDNVRYAPVIFQEYIQAEYDLRVTVVGDHIFPAAIYSQETDYPVDFRMEINDVRMEAVELPEEVNTRLHQLMARLGLVYGAIDMRLTPTGEYVFLEINPAGQWLFVEEVTKQPIAETLAALLVERARGS